MTWEDLQKEPTGDLIDYMKCKNEPAYKTLAEAAFAAFTYRFQKEITDKCRKLGKHWEFNMEICDQLADRTFENFWRKPYKFEKAKCEKLSIDECAKYYLFKTAQRCFCDYARDILKIENSPYDGSEEVIIDFPVLETIEISDAKINMLQEMQTEMERALASLSPKHKIIYLTYKAYEKGGFKLPRPLLQKLRDETKLRQNTIRVYKKEAFKKVEEYNKQNGQE